MIYDDEYPGFEEYGVPTPAQIEAWYQKQERQRAEEAYRREHPVQGCRDITLPPMFRLSAMDAVLRDIYALALRESVNKSNSFTTL